MQDSSSPPLRSVDSARSNGDLVAHLGKSGIYRDYQKAFETITGLPLAIRAPGSFRAPMQGSRFINPFCALMADRSKSCGACLQLQERVEADAREEAGTRDCFAGLSESSIPIRIGEHVVAFLQTGQVLRRKPSEAQFARTLRRLGEWGSEAEIKELKAAFFSTRVMAKEQYESILRLLSIFAQHLSALSNQLVVKQGAAERPAVSKARSFIVAHQGEQISLLHVAKAVNMSAFYFCKIFKRTTGLSFIDYLARVRVESVKNLLVNPHKRVSEAAFEAGFQSLSQFNRVFRRIEGEAPSDYRERLHGGGGRGLGDDSRLAHAI